MPKRRREGSSTEDFTIEILDGDSEQPYTTLYHRRSKSSFVVAQPGQEYKVRITIKPSAWELHDHDWFFAKLLVDDRYVRGRFMERPRGYYQDYEVDSDVSWTFKTMQGGWALKFAERGTGTSDKLVERDSYVGRIQVIFMAAETRRHRAPYRGEWGNRRRGDDDEFIESRTWDKSRVNQSQKEKLSLLRTVKGRRLEEPRRGGGGGASPATVVNDYVYATVVVQYDTADHLRYRGILRPNSLAEHRQFFPGEDFRSQMRQRTKATVPKVRTIADLTGDDDMEDPDWAEKVTWKKMRSANETVEEKEEARIQLANERQRRRNALSSNIQDPDDDGDGDYVDLEHSERVQSYRTSKKRRVDDDQEFETLYDD